MTDFEVVQFISGKMFAAVICGAVVGLERNLNEASAGFKTQILVCVGSMLFTIIPLVSTGVLAGDQGRVIAQIISGVGFLGAGAILHNGSSHVIGLTTAAWTWFTAAVGILIGLEHGPAAIFTTVTLVLVITAARKIEAQLFRHRRDRRASDRLDLKRAKSEEKNSDRSAA
jgi:putative Mg2+ transporter-C (MgtC) family protein